MRRKLMMKFKKMVEDVELPERVAPHVYVNIRSAERRDVRGSETINIKTGVMVLVGGGEIATVFGAGPFAANVVPREIKTGNKYYEIIITVRNNGLRNIMIYPGQVLASISTHGERKLP
jgi:hypothetical protein